MTDEETQRTYARAEELRVQITTLSREMFGCLASLGLPPVLVMLLPDGEHTMHELAIAREAAARELGEITAEIRVRERQLVFLKRQEGIDLGGPQCS